MISINERSNKILDMVGLEDITAIRVDTLSEYGTTIDLLSKTGSYGLIAESDDDMGDIADAYDKQVVKPYLIGITERELLEFRKE